jgi:hypothetical protein
MLHLEQMEDRCSVTTDLISPTAIVSETLSSGVVLGMFWTLNCHLYFGLVDKIKSYHLISPKGASILTPDRNYSSGASKPSTRPASTYCRPADPKR